MGYPQSIALFASKNVENLHQAIEWIMTSNDSPQQNDYMHTLCCNGLNISNCASSQRIISLLKYYQNNHQNHNKLSKYLEKYKTYLVSDFHHFLDKHLNEQVVTTTQSREQFDVMFKELNDNNIKCDIGKCKMYSRNNRQRESVNIECEDKQLCTLIDIIDTIHCFFVHSIDIGYRIPTSLTFDDIEDKEDDDINRSNAYNLKIARLRKYLLSKRSKLEAIKGKQRLIHTKFITDTTS